MVPPNTTTKASLTALMPIPISCALPEHVVLPRPGAAPLLSGLAKKAEKDRFKVNTGPEIRGSR